MLVGVGEKPRSEEPTRILSEKILPNPNRNWLNIWMGSKFWCLKNQNRTRPEPKYLGYPNVTEIDLYI